MDTKKIKILLECYFEGNSSLAEEQLLRNYFLTTKNIPSALEKYRVLFAYYQKAQHDKFPNKKSKKPLLFSFAAVAASIAFIVYFSLPINNTTTPLSVTDQEEAMAVYQEFKSNLLIVSNRYNEGVQKIAYLDYWNQTTKKLIK